MALYGDDSVMVAMLYLLAPLTQHRNATGRR